MISGRGGLAALLAALLAACAAAPPPPAPTFGTLGDVPYSQAGANLLDVLIDRMNSEPLGFVVHVGDITSGQGPCSDEWFDARRRQFARSRHPFVVLPGDNDWVDCHRSGFDPLERLARWRALFCTPRDAPLPALARQSDVDPRHAGYCEHLRWEHDGVLYVTLNIQGSNDNVGRDAAMNAEQRERRRAVGAWLDAAIARARLPAYRALVVFIHANPQLERTVTDPYAALRERLRAAPGAAGKPVLLVHGDTHRYVHDSPAPGLQRIEVPGWPDVQWVRVSIGSDGRALSETVSAY